MKNILRDIMLLVPISSKSRVYKTDTTNRFYIISME